MDGPPEGKKLKRGGGGGGWIEREGERERERSKTKMGREERGSAAGPVGGMSEDMQSSELDSFLRRLTQTWNVPDRSPSTLYILAIAVSVHPYLCKLLTDARR